MEADTDLSLPAAAATSVVRFNVTRWLLNGSKQALSGTSIEQIIRARPREQPIPWTAAHAALPDNVRLAALLGMIRSGQLLFHSSDIGDFMKVERVQDATCAFCNRQRVAFVFETVVEAAWAEEPLRQREEAAAAAAAQSPRVIAHITFHVINIHVCATRKCVFNARYWVRSRRLQMAEIYSMETFMAPNFPTLPKSTVYLFKMCRTCKKASPRLGDRFKVCGQCYSTSYCSVACQRKDWVDGGHRTFCANSRKEAAAHNAMLDEFSDTLHLVLPQTPDLANQVWPGEQRRHVMRTIFWIPSEHGYAMVCLSSAVIDAPDGPAWPADTWDTLRYLEAHTNPIDLLKSTRIPGSRSPLAVTFLPFAAATHCFHCGKNTAGDKRARLLFARLVHIYGNTPGSRVARVNYHYFVAVACASAACQFSTVQTLHKKRTEASDSMSFQMFSAMIDVQSPHSRDFLPTIIQQPVMRLDTCAHCNKSAVSLGRQMRHCTRCFAASYCSRECQVANYAVHKRECKRTGGSNLDTPKHANA